MVLYGTINNTATKCTVHVHSDVSTNKVKYVKCSNERLLDFRGIFRILKVQKFRILIHISALEVAGTVLKLGCGFSS